MARVNVDGLTAGRWHDVADDNHLADLESLAFVSRVGDHGEPPPVVIPTRCCNG